MTQKLRASGVIKSLELLQRRAEERFPGSGMSEACGEVVAIAHKTEARAKALGRPNVIRPIIVLVVTALLMGAFVLAVWAPLSPAAMDHPWLSPFDPTFSAYDLLEVAASVLILIIGPILWLRDWGTRSKRRFAMKHLHELRSYAHVVDMQQLTKDPVALSPNAVRTASSPDRSMTPYQLARYLSYCTELEALLGKLAALYGEFTNDPEISSSVNDIEALTSGISQKIWQKIMTLDNEIAMDHAADKRSADAGPMVR